MKTDITFIYTILYNGSPIYIGQTTDTKRRFCDHRRNIKYRTKTKMLYSKIINIDNLQFKLLKIVPLREARSEEIRYIKHCLKKGKNLLNNCSVSNQLKLKYGFIK